MLGRIPTGKRAQDGERGGDLAGELVNGSVDAGRSPTELVRDPIRLERAYPDLVPDDVESPESTPARPDCPDNAESDDSSRESLELTGVDWPRAGTSPPCDPPYSHRR